MADCNDQRLKQGLEQLREYVISIIKRDKLQGYNDKILSPDKIYEATEVRIPISYLLKRQERKATLDESRIEEYEGYKRTGELAKVSVKSIEAWVKILGSLYFLLEKLFETPEDSTKTILKFKKIAGLFYLLNLPFSSYLKSYVEQIDNDEERYPDWKRTVRNVLNSYHVTVYIMHPN